MFGQPEYRLIMKIRTILVVLTVAAGPHARATDSFNSELSHFSGNLAIAAVTTVVIDKTLPKVKRPALTGFLVSTTEAVLGEVIPHAMGQGKISALDIAAGTLGAAAGAYATDKWYLQPKMETRRNETTAGLMVVRRF